MNNNPALTTQGDHKADPLNVNVAEVANVVYGQAQQDEQRPQYRVQIKVKPVSAQRAKSRDLTDSEIVDMARAILRRRNSLKGLGGFAAPQAVRDYLADHFLGCEREEFTALLLDSQHRLIETVTLHKGTINAAPVYPRELIKQVVKYNAAAVILAHNHPSGTAEPSQADHRVTERLKKALQMIDVSLLDHFVVGDPEITSFAERGLL